MKKFMFMLALLLCTAVAAKAQLSKPSVFQLYKVMLSNTTTNLDEFLKVDYPMTINDGVVSFDNAGDHTYKVTQSTVVIKETSKTTSVITSRGIDNKGKFVSLKLYMSPELAYFTAYYPGYAITYFFSMY